MKTKDLTGQKFGRLTALKPTKKRSGHNIIWLCQCDCGNIYEVSSNSLCRNLTKSCGCLRKERTAETHTKHGYSKHQLYSVWSALIQRCENPNDSRYKDYGGRGISVCDEWQNSAKAFVEWALANGWEKGLTIERQNNNGNYEPKNCWFATYLEQNNNTRKLKLFIAYGPEGQIEISKNQHAFARKWELTRESICACLNNRQKSHNNWTFERMSRREKT